MYSSPTVMSADSWFALEEFKDIPFRIKRVYYMYDTADGGDAWLPCA